MPNFEQFDASGRDPRPIQADTLRKLSEQWNDSDVHALILPVGTGKSAVLRAIQVSTGADILTPSNILVEQYTRDYPHVNFLKGKTHYNCRSGMSCKDWNACGFDPCEGCPYQTCKEKANEGFATFFNPMSYYFHLLNSRSKGAKVLCVDEAHQLPSMVLMLCGKRLKKSEYKFTEKCTNELYLLQWIKQQIDRMDRLSAMYYKKNDLEKVAHCKDEIETLALIKEGLEEDPQNYVIWIAKQGHETYLNVKPLFPPRFLMNRIIGNKKLILTSGTLFEHDIRAIVGDKHYNVIEQNSPIPKKNRPVFYKPAPFKMNFQTDPKKIADLICSHLKPGVNTLIHSTYSLSKKLAPYMPVKTIVNTQEDKDEKLQEFKEKGGIFLASGCAEGIDLKHDFCRLNIIPKMSFPDLNDPGVQKRKALEDGERWYALQTMLTLIQQVGRSTRGPDDWSEALILDPNFGRLFAQTRRWLPKYFTESVQWS